MTPEVAQCFKNMWNNRRNRDLNIVIDGKSGFFNYDQEGKPMLALHWEHYCNRIVTKYNETYKAQLPNITPHVLRHSFCSKMDESKKPVVHHGTFRNCSDNGYLHPYGIRRCPRRLFESSRSINLSHNLWGIWHMNIKKGLGYEGVKIPQIVPQTSDILGVKRRKNKRKFEENGIFLTSA